MYITAVKTRQEIQAVVDKATIIWYEHFVPIIGKEQVAYMLDKFLSMDAIETAIVNGYEFYILREEEVFGFLSLQKGENSLFLSKFYIDVQHRGKGYARQCLSFIEKIARQANLKTIHLSVNKDNLSTISIYEKMGFSIYEEAVNDIGNGFVMDDYYMKKEINDQTKI